MVDDALHVIDLIVKSLSPLESEFPDPSLTRRSFSLLENCNNKYNKRRSSSSPPHKFVVQPNMEINIHGNLDQHLNTHLKRIMFSLVENELYII